MLNKVKKARKERSKQMVTVSISIMAVEQGLSAKLDLQERPSR